MSETVDSKAEFLANAFTTSELIDALATRFEKLRNGYKKISNERYGQFQFQMLESELNWLKCETEKGLAFRQETFDRFCMAIRGGDLKDVVFEREVILPLGDDQTQTYRRGTITFIKPDYSLKYGGV